MVGQRLLIDTNLLVLLIVGSVDPQQIYKHRRLSQYNEESFRVLLQFLSDYQQLWVTSHVVAETSNLLKGENLKQTKLFRLKFCEFLGTAYVRESHLGAQLLLQKYQATILRIGAPDCGIIQKAIRVNNVITDDFDLYASIVQRGLHATKFEHLLREKLLL